MTELEQLRQRVAYLERVRETAWRQLAERDAEIKRLRHWLEGIVGQNTSPLYRSPGAGRRWERT